MIKEAYVSFEIAKLLKEKGFNWDCITYYVDSEPNKVEYSMLFENNTTWEERCYSAPTYQMAMAWLREVHNLQIQITPIISRHKDWTFGIYKEFNPLTIDLVCFPTYEEAVEAALKYSLENLIRKKQNYELRTEI